MSALAWGREIRPFKSDNRYCNVAKHAVLADAEFTLVTPMRWRLGRRLMRRSACDSCALEFSRRFGVAMPEAAK